jgi:hypothetical protein
MNIKNFLKVDLTEYYNNSGINFPEATDANFTHFGASYPGEGLPMENEIIVESIPFLFPYSSIYNNIEFEKQKILLPLSKYKALYVLGSSDNGSFTEQIDLYNQGEFLTSCQLSLTDWVSNFPEYSEIEAYRCNCLVSNGRQVNSLQPVIWLQKVLLDQNNAFNEVRLPDNPCMHVFSITLEKVWGS